ncbi:MULTISPECIES: hypothetical protein [Pseudomonadaceae]|uniref:hypothetical protein n=1 Tax=Pseudomonadaceae TaxID=135621 RepID=UPI000B5A55EA|nr:MULTISPECIES: hypothetical protein [Pseudomonas aeruginosa group]ASJ88512.1 hypothetical protein PSA83_06386 [Pseudomonas aeruginosa]EKU6308730.1 hypothetical protein [Pseudomonas aeruginosa]EKX2970308.1 hypothetical protein [Pseudomonas aeruginosa]MBO8337252.1 hypothetical protein [Pseudomonas aeruginosa]MCO3749645.1 hypothetical protein [Pseudomonas aeruginosa]
MKASFSPSETFANKPVEPSFTADQLQWHLTRLYALWDELKRVKSEADGSIATPFLHFPAGTPSKDICEWFESVNVRFNCDKVSQGDLLEPLTSRADWLPVYDRNGVQICLGDKLRAQISTGRYGAVGMVEAVAAPKHLPYAALSAQRNGKDCSIYFNAYFVSGFDVGYHCSNDFEHGRETWVEVVFD